MTSQNNDGLAALLSRQHHARRSALDAFKRNADEARDNSLTALERRRVELHASHAAAVAGAEAAVEAHHNDLDQELAREICAALDPLMAEFPDAPRTTSAAIAKAWKQFHARADEELGCEPSAIHLGMAFAVAHGVVAETGEQEFWSGAVDHHPLGSAGRVSNAILSGALTPELEELIRQLEKSVTKSASEPRARVSVSANRALCIARAGCYRGWATGRGMARALTEVMKTPEERIRDERERNSNLRAAEHVERRGTIARANVRLDTDIAPDAPNASLDSDIAPETDR